MSNQKPKCCGCDRELVIERGIECSGCGEYCCPECCVEEMISHDVPTLSLGFDLLPVLLPRTDVFTHCAKCVAKRYLNVKCYHPGPQEIVIYTIKEDPTKVFPTRMKGGSETSFTYHPVYSPHFADLITKFKHQLLST